MLFVGFGNLGSQVFDLFVLRAKKGDQFLVGGRNVAYIRERVRWAVSAALQLGVLLRRMRRTWTCAISIKPLKPSLIEA